MADPVLSSAQYVLREALADLRTVVEGLPAESLNWRPAGPETNSIAVLVTHAMHSTRSWLSVAMGAPLPERDRPSEFLAWAGDPAALLRFLDDMSAQCRDLLDSAEEVDWAASRKTHGRTGDSPEQAPAAFSLIDALEHLREHVAHISLTRQLWEGGRTAKQGNMQA
jgi:hypothetical protein